MPHNPTHEFRLSGQKRRHDQEQRWLAKQPRRDAATATQRQKFMKKRTAENLAQADLEAAGYSTEYGNPNYITPKVLDTYRRTGKFITPDYEKFDPSTGTYSPVAGAIPEGITPEMEERGRMVSQKYREGLTAQTMGMTVPEYQQYKLATDRFAAGTEELRSGTGRAEGLAGAQIGLTEAQGDALTQGAATSQYGAETNRLLGQGGLDIQNRAEDRQASAQDVMNRRNLEESRRLEDSFRNAILPGQIGQLEADQARRATEIARFQPERIEAEQRATVQSEAGLEQMRNQAAFSMEIAAHQRDVARADMARERALLQGEEAGRLLQEAFTMNDQLAALEFSIQEQFPREIDLTWLHPDWKFEAGWLGTSPEGKAAIDAFRELAKANKGDLLLLQSMAATGSPLLKSAMKTFQNNFRTQIQSSLPISNALRRQLVGDRAVQLPQPQSSP